MQPPTGVSRRQQVATQSHAKPSAIPYPNTAPEPARFSLEFEVERGKRHPNVRGKPLEIDLSAIHIDGLAGDEIAVRGDHVPS
ncbi:MAG: hypothetical protein KTR19_01610, partial [Hyphomicrobiales bacterium]|nr:hypothetical protein [Hyphomicrobiales bacterium]